MHLIIEAGFLLWSLLWGQNEPQPG